MKQKFHHNSWDGIGLFVCQYQEGVVLFNNSLSIALEMIKALFYLLGLATKTRSGWYGTLRV